MVGNGPSSPRPQLPSRDLSRFIPLLLDAARADLLINQDRAFTRLAPVVPQHASFALCALDPHCWSASVRLRQNPVRGRRMGQALAAERAGLSSHSPHAVGIQYQPDSAHCTLITLPSRRRRGREEDRLNGSAGRLGLLAFPSPRRRRTAASSPTWLRWQHCRRYRQLMAGENTSDGLRWRDPLRPRRAGGDMVAPATHQLRCRQVDLGPTGGATSRGFSYWIGQA